MKLLDVFTCNIDTNYVLWTSFSLYWKSNDFIIDDDNESSYLSSHFQDILISLFHLPLFAFQIFRSLLQARVGTFLAGDIYQKADFDATIDLNGMTIELGSAKKKIDFDNDQNSNNTTNKNNHAEKYSNGADKKNSSRGSRGDASTKSTSFVTMVCDNDNGNGNGIDTIGKKSPASPSHSYNFAEYTEGKSKSLDIGDGFLKSKSGVLREKGTRRTRVSQCKNLRGFILGFENNWLLKHGVAAKVFIHSFSISCIFKAILSSLPFLLYDYYQHFLKLCCYFT